jgi:phage shock protein C
LASQVAGTARRSVEDEVESVEDWIDDARDRWESKSRRRSSAHARRAARRKKRKGMKLYRDPDQAKVCGVCAGLADYFAVDTWKVRFGAILGLIFVPQLTFTGYFIAYFLMDKKPYYRRVTDRFDRKREGEWDPLAEEDVDEEDAMVSGTGSERQGTPNGSRKPYAAPRMSNATALRTAKNTFADLEDRVRSMESHVTSSRFELQRELNKISGEGQG